MRPYTVFCKQITHSLSPEEGPVEEQVVDIGLARDADYVFKRVV